MAEQIMSLVALRLESQTLNEATDKRTLLKQADEMLKRVGFTTRQETGILQYLAGAGVGVAEMLVAALKGDKEGIKQVASGVTKEKLLDFFLKLDVLTLHLLSSPIHIIDAITGWDLHSNLRNTATKGVKAVVQTFSDAIKFIKEKLTTTRVSEQDKQRIAKELADLEDAMSAIINA